MIHTTKTCETLLKPILKLSIPNKKLKFKKLIGVHVVLCGMECIDLETDPVNYFRNSRLL